MIFCHSKNKIILSTKRNLFYLLNTTKYEVVRRAKKRFEMKRSCNRLLNFKPTGTNIIPFTDDAFMLTSAYFLTISSDFLYYPNDLHFFFNLTIIFYYSVTILNQHYFKSRKLYIYTILRSTYLQT